MRAKALMRAGDRPGEQTNKAAAAKAFRWIVAMQNDDGGWAAFDKTKDRPWMEAIPFADHNAMQDPSCADITGRTIESLVTCGMSPDHPAIRKARKMRSEKPNSDLLSPYNSFLIAVARLSEKTGVPFGAINRTFLDHAGATRRGPYVPPKDRRPGRR